LANGRHLHSHDSYLPSLLDFLFAIRSIDGDVSSKPPMNQKVPGLLSANYDSNIDMEKCEQKYCPFQPKLMRHPRLPKQHQWVRSNLLLF
jgi:hypothetical protein